MTLDDQKTMLPLAVQRICTWSHVGQACRGGWSWRACNSSQHALVTGRYQRTCDAPSRGRSLLEGSLKDPDILYRKLSPRGARLELSLARVGSKSVQRPDPYGQLRKGALLILQE